MSRPRWIRSAGLLDAREFPATAAGYADLLHRLERVRGRRPADVEGTGSDGAGLARHLAAAGVRVVEVDRADLQDRHRQGKPDPLDAVSAARAAQSGRAPGAPKGRDGAVETTRSGCAAKPRGRTCAVPPRSRPPPARSAGIASTAAATAGPTTRYGGS